MEVGDDVVELPFCKAVNLGSKAARSNDRHASEMEKTRVPPHGRASEMKKTSLLTMIMLLL